MARRRTKTGGAVTQVEHDSSRRARRSSSNHGLTGSAPGAAFGADPLGLDAEGAEHELRGRHATLYGQGFSWVLVWTILGAIIPGTGLIAAGSRRSGAFVLSLVGLAIAAGAGFFLFGDVLRQSLSVAVDVNNLLVAAVVATVVALAWAAIIVITNSQLRQHADLTSGQSWFSGIVVLALLVAVALPGYKVGSTALITRDLLGSITSDDGEPDGVNLGNGEKADPWASLPRVNVLLIGSDAGKGRIGTRPDTMIVASIDTKTGNTVLLSLPRNLERAPFPPGTGGAQAWPNGFYCEQDACLLNAVWAWAEGAGKQYYPPSKYRNPGLRATEDAIQGVTGLKIHTFASLNLMGFREFVDALGGVKIDVYERLPIGGNSNNPVATGGWIEVGKNQKLDGYRALWFARSRWSTDDYDRMRRQRCVIGAVVEQASPTKMVKKFPQLAAAAKGNIFTGIKPKDLQAWVDLALRIKDAKVTSLPFDDKVVTSRVNPDFDQIRSLVQGALDDSMAPETPATAQPSAGPSAGPTAGSTPDSSASPSVKPTKKPVDPTKAQSIKDVC
jgi:LCP family protein required for cell wall assembly